MIGSDGTGSGIGVRTLFRRLGRLAQSVSRYDLLLACIPAAFAVAFTVSALSNVPTRGAIVGASLVGAVAIVDGMFRRPPRLSETEAEGA